MPLQERLIIKNFSIFKDIDFTINKFNIVIGEQATGKSLLSKIIFFFQQIVPQLFTFAIIEGKDFDAFEKGIKKDFFAIFPEYFWEKQEFKIRFNYRLKDTYIVISRDITSRRPSINLEVANRIERRFDEIKRNFDLRKVDKEVFKTFNTHITIFTPASRSFFSLIQKNIFSLSLLGVSTDLFINQFGVYYEKFKSLSAIEQQDIRELYSDILKGEFYFDRKQDEIFIYSDDGNKVRLKDASTGQQELVPIFILLNAIIQEKNIEHFLIIEEPGSHLFPGTQKKLMELFALIFNYTNKKTGFLFTTHSPYILTSFNNLIQAGNVLKVAREKNYPDIDKEIGYIILPSKAIDFDDVSVYMIKNGSLELLMDTEYRLIMPELLDKVSDEIAEEFNKLVELENRIENETVAG